MANGPRPSESAAAGVIAPQTRPRIWLCADDFGMAPGVNAAILDLLRRRRINATSVMSVAHHLAPERVEELAHVARETGAAVGLHLTLTAPYEPLSGAFRPLRGGAFLPLGQLILRAMLRRLEVSAVRAEIAAQFAAFEKSFGKPPDFVDGHQHVHLLPQVRDAVLQVVQERARRAWVRQCGRLRGIPDPRNPKAAFLEWLSRNFSRRAAAHGIPFNLAFAGAYTFTDQADFASLFPRFLEGMPEGGVVMCHPGFVDAELERLDPLTTLREREHAYFSGDTFPAALARAGVALF